MTRLEKGGFSKSSNDVAEDDQLIGMPSSSSSVPMVSDLSNNIHTDTAIEGDALIQHKSQLLDFIEKLKKSSHLNAAQLSSSFFIFKGFLSEGINVVDDIILGEAKTIVCLYYSLRYFGKIRNPLSQRRGVGPNIKGEAIELIVHGSIIEI